MPQGLTGSEDPLTPWVSVSMSPMLGAYGDFGGLDCFGGWALVGGVGSCMEVGAALWLELEKEDLLRPFSSGRLSDFVWFV